MVVLDSGLLRRVGRILKKALLEDIDLCKCMILF
jgi:hypothetical protein